MAFDRQFDLGLIWRLALILALGAMTILAFLEGGGAAQIAEQAAHEGIWDLRRSALQKVKDGVTSLEEINRVTIE